MPWKIPEARVRFQVPRDKRMHGSELHAIRKLLGDEVRGDMSQPVFAALLGISQRTLRRYEHGQTVPSLVAREARRLQAVRENMDRRTPGRTH